MESTLRSTEYGWSGTFLHNSEKMTNQSLRERFNLSDDKTATVFQIIAATVETVKIKPTEPTQTPNRCRSNVPLWA
jgi:ATP-dependent DNA helicase RecG